MGYAMTNILIEAVTSFILLVLAFALLNILRFRNTRRALRYALFGFYLAAVYSIVGLPTVQFLTFDATLNLIPFIPMKEDLRNSVLNVILFVPLGFFLPYLWNRYRRMGETLLVGFCATLAIELGQLLTYRVTDINDILTKTTDLRSKIRPIQFYPETYSAQDLLEKLSKKRQSIAVVVDEFGGTSGIISIEDLIEEIFGEIEDEYDEEDAVEKTINPDDYIFSARLEIDYLNKNYKFNFPESDDYETLAGYIIHYHESIPQIGEEIVIGNYVFKIIKATDTRLEEVEIKNNQ